MKKGTDYTVEYFTKFVMTSVPYSVFLLHTGVTMPGFWIKTTGTLSLLYLHYGSRFHTDDDLYLRGLKKISSTK
jgi:hypothetical protein